MFGKSVPVALAALMAASTVQAGEPAKAQLQGVTGDVVIMQAKGVLTARTGAVLAPGDRVVVKTGQAGLRYGDGCAVTLKAGSMATVGGASPCAGGAGIVSANPAEPAAFGKAFSHLTPGGVVAGVGVVILAGAVVDGVINSDHSCNTFVDPQCNATSP